jgi:hypothetical protein
MDVLWAPGDVRGDERRADCTVALFITVGFLGASAPPMTGRRWPRAACLRE